MNVPIRTRVIEIDNVETPRHPPLVSRNGQSGRIRLYSPSNETLKFYLECQIELQSTHETSEVDTPNGNMRTLIRVSEMGMGSANDIHVNDAIPGKWLCTLTDLRYVSYPLGHEQTRIPQAHNQGCRESGGRRINDGISRAE